MKYDFVEIGTSDFETENDLSKVFRAAGPFPGENAARRTRWISSIVD